MSTGRSGVNSYSIHHNGSGLVVPRDLSVVGFDDSDAAPLVTPPLTTVHVPTQSLGAQAVRMLLNEEYTRETVSPWGYEMRLKTSLVVRGTTAQPRY